MDDSARAEMHVSKEIFGCRLLFTLRVDWGGMVSGRNAMLYHMVQYCTSILIGIATHCRALSRIVNSIVSYCLILFMALSDIVRRALSHIVAHCHCCVLLHCHCRALLHCHCRALSLWHCRALSRIPKLALSRIHYIRCGTILYHIVSYSEVSSSQMVCNPAHSI